MRLIFCLKPLAALLATLSILAGMPSAQAIEAGELRFRVLLDNREIGEHRFVISANDGGKDVHSEARFDVRILGIPVFRYRHQNFERWGEDGCLYSISSRTTSNSDSFEVDGHRDAGAGFRVATDSAERALHEGCLMTFAYWDRSFLGQPRLLNSQTGEVLDVSVEPLPRDTAPRMANGGELDGDRILSEDGDTDIRVGYDADPGRWMGLESRVANDRLLAYVRATD